MSALHLVSIITFVMFILGNFGNFSIKLKDKGNELLHRTYWIAWWVLIGLAAYLANN